jgi:hypothetical protein
LRFEIENGDPISSFKSEISNWILYSEAILSEEPLYLSRGGSL